VQGDRRAEVTVSSVNRARIARRAARSGSRSPRPGSNPWLSWIFLAPAMILVGGLMYYPMIGTIIESLYSTSFINPKPQFVGLELYRRVFGSGGFGAIVRNSCVWTIGVVLLQNVFGFATALLLNQRLPGTGLMRSLILLPWVLPGVVGAILWRFMYDPQLGLINSFLIRLGLTHQGIPWLADQSTAMAAAIIAAVWKGFPFSTVVYLAALQNVDHEQIEAAVIDGAGGLMRLFHVVLPAMREVIITNLLLTTILTFNYFDMIWVLTRGGPQNATHIFPTKIYELGFGEFRFGEAATYGVFSIIVLALLITLYFLVQGSANRWRSSTL
jgi:multiple sugar transport system permease protein